MKSITNLKNGNLTAGVHTPPVDEEVKVVEGDAYLDLPSATDEDIQSIINGYGHEDDGSNNTLSSSYEFDDSNIPVATDEDIQAIIDGYRRIF